MSYNTHNFQSGSILYASQLNEMDNQLAHSDSFFNGKPGINFEVGLIYGTTGGDGSFSKRLRSVGYIDSRIDSIVVASGYRAYLYAYTPDGTYMGAWTANGLAKTNSTLAIYNRVELSYFRNLHGNKYIYRIMGSKPDSSAEIEIDTDSAAYTVGSYRTDYIDSARIAGNRLSLEPGLLSITSGAVSSFNKRMNTGFIPDCVAKVSIDTSHKAYLYAYNNANGNYIGCYNNNSEFGNTDNLSAFYTEIDVAAFKEKYPLYKFRLLVARVDSGVMSVEQDGNCLTVSTERNDNPESYYGCLGVYKRMGVIGDSFASGATFDTQGTGVASYWVSWIQILARRCGNIGVNFSYGGCTTRRWLDTSFDSKGLTKLNTEDPCDIYFICLGINDSDTNAVLHVDLGTPADITTMADTYYGNMAKIVSKIQTRAPNARIVILSTPKTGTRYDEYDAAACKAAEQLGLPYIYLKHDDFFTSSQYGFVQAHPTANGYGGMALAIERLYAKCTGKYFDYFKAYAGYVN